MFVQSSASWVLPFFPPDILSSLLTSCWAFLVLCLLWNLSGHCRLNRSSTNFIVEVDAGAALSLHVGSNGAEVAPLALKLALGK